MFGPGEADCYRRVAALYSDHYRQVPLYIKCLDQGRLAAIDRWLRYTVTTIDRFHCTWIMYIRNNLKGGPVDWITLLLDKLPAHAHVWMHEQFVVWSSLDGLSLTRGNVQYVAI